MLAVQVVGSRKFLTTISIYALVVMGLYVPFLLLLGFSLRGGFFPIDLYNQTIVTLYNSLLKYKRLGILIIKLLPFSLETRKPEPFFLLSACTV